MVVSRKKIILLLSFLLLISSYGINTTIYSYLIFFLMVSLSFQAMMQRKLQVVAYDIIPLLFLFSWLYGIFNGIYNAVNLVNVFSNFAGITLFSLYYTFCLFDIDKKSIVKVLACAGFVNSMYSISNIYLILNAEYDGTDINSFRMYYSNGMLVVLPFLSLILYRLSFKKNANSSFLRSTTILSILALTVIFSLLIMVSKGFALALVFLLSVFMSVILLRLLIKLRLKWGGLVIATLIASFLGISGYLFFDIIAFNLSSKQAGNSIRSEQAIHLIEDFTFWGSGLGSALSSGYIRDIRGYGFELSFHNLIHKIGIFSSMIFFAYIFLLSKSVWLMTTKPRGIDAENVFIAFGCLLSLVPSYGNPILFSPVSAFLQVIALFLLRPGYKKKISIA